MKKRRSNIELGLAVIAALRPAGVVLTQRDIAEICGCSFQRIQQIEWRALEKLRAAAAALEATIDEIEI